MDGLEIAATTMCCTDDCPVCEVPKDELDRTDVSYPLLSVSAVRAQVAAAQAALLEPDGSVKPRCIGRVSTSSYENSTSDISYIYILCYIVLYIYQYHIRYLTYISYTISFYTYMVYFIVYANRIVYNIVYTKIHDIVYDTAYAKIYCITFSVDR